MNFEQTTYLTKSGKPFDALIAALEESAAKRNFRVLHKHNIQATLAEKGFELSPYMVIEVCNSAFAHSILTKEKTVGMMLPCRIAVYEDGGTNSVVMMKPTLMSGMMPGVDLGSIPADVERILIEVVDEAVA